MTLPDQNLIADRVRDMYEDMLRDHGRVDAIATCIDAIGRTELNSQEREELWERAVSVQERYNRIESARTQAVNEIMEVLVYAY